MNHLPMHSQPRAADVFREQVRAIVLALRPAAIAALAVLILGSALAIGEFVTSGGRVDFAPELSMVPGFVGLLFPIAVWRGERRFGTSFLWMLPVDRSRHALIKIAAGWVCLMATVLFFVLWLLVLAILTGGNLLAEQTVQLLPSAVVPESGTLAPSALRAMQYAPERIFWLVPFTAATAAYALSSAIAIGSKYPLRWVIGVPLAILALSALGAAAHVDWLKLLASRVIESVNEGRYGLDALFTARAESLKTSVVLTTGKTVNVWRGLPDVADWAVATLFWLAGGLGALMAAASRQRETSRRR